MEIAKDWCRSSEKRVVSVMWEITNGEKLRQEIIDLGLRFGFRDVVSDREGWRGVYGVLINLVTDKPLSPPLNLKAGSTLRISAGTTQAVNVPSTIRLWLHGNRGQQVEWTVVIVPNSHNFDMANLTGLTVLNGGLFTLP